MKRMDKLRIMMAEDGEGIRETLQYVDLLK